MGCCFSKENDSSKSPNEGSRLLPGDGTNYDTPRMIYPPPPDAEAEHEREQELLQIIVQRTAENLIDISNSQVIERLQQQDVIDRVNEYNELFNTIKLDNMTLLKIKENSNSTMPKLRNKCFIQSVFPSTKTEPETKVETSTLNVKSSNNNNLSPDVILSGGIVTKEDQDLLFKAMDEINEAIEHIEIDYVGDLVVPLT
ncbi:hypothetical protein Glove_421g8 [Diversispora epigaea]|uniref:Ragulator complex protein LAMTOR1 n=1 Tax=Diversispora epigaea TaxID=1348612 RepID=A0A397GVW0_9GLOM|nr:hypothetical protein Glove_421g8 [Diversispora epigaea]